MKTFRALNNILIIKPGAIGDLLQLTPVIRALRAAYPDAGISLVVGTPATAELFRHNPQRVEPIVFDRKGEHRSFRSLLRLWQRLRRDQYDLVINFQRSTIKTWLLATAAFPCRVLVYHKVRNRTVHVVANYLETIAPLGITTEDFRLTFDPGADARAFAETVLPAHGPRDKPPVALNPGASHPVNRWGTARFAELADLLAERLSVRVVIVGGKDDVSLAEEIAAQARSKPLVMAGKATLLQLGALLEQCAVLVSGDTGPLHLATAVGTRVVALFGAADPARTGPVGSGHRVLQAEDVACVPCRSRTCANSVYRECMEKISVQQVFDAVAEIVQGR